MRALENVSAAHVNLADAYFDWGPGISSARDPAALPERRRHRGVAGAGTDRGELLPARARRVRETLKREPTSATALMQFSRVFWEWRQAAADRVVPREPGIAHAREAEWYARRAVAMVEAKLDGASSSLIVVDRSDRDARGALTRSVPGTFALPPPTRWPASARCSSRRRGPTRRSSCSRPQRRSRPSIRRSTTSAGCAARRSSAPRRGNGARSCRGSAGGTRNWRETHRPQLDVNDALRQEAGAAWTASEITSGRARGDRSPAARTRRPIRVCRRTGSRT